VLACPAVVNDQRKRAATSSPAPSGDEVEREDDDTPDDTPEDNDGDDPDEGSPDEDDGDQNDDENDEEEEEEEEEEDRRAPARRRKPLSEMGRKRLGQVAAFVIAGVIVAVYGANCYLNSVVSEEVSEYCLAEEQRLDQAILDATEDRLPALEWNLNLYRARRRYVREICQVTADQLDWWRWNLTSRIEADISERTQQEISKTMGRASMSCESEIAAMEEALVREMKARDSTSHVRARVDEMVKGQLESCHELGVAVENSRPGFWPPLKASGTLDVEEQIKALMPRSFQEVSKRMETPR
jgi:hypothetical protein